MDHPPLPDTIAVLPGTDVEDAWERFHPFEALHHLHTICDPLTSDDLDEVVATLDPRDGDRVLDVACGHGELLARMAERADIDGTGIDLSPWVLLRAIARAPRLAWWLGDGAATPDDTWDITTCLGGSWIWDGFKGTAAALAARASRRIAIGDLRLRSPADRVALGDAPEAASLTEGEQVDSLRSLDLEPITQIVPDESAWRGYHELVIESARTYAQAHPDDPGADHVAMAESSMRNEYERLTAHLAWTVWVADVT